VRGETVERVFPLIDEASGNPVESPGLRAMRERRNVALEQPTLLVAADGARIPVDDTAAPIVDEHGSLLGSVIAFRDSRERRRREEALRHAEQQLHHARRMEAVGQLAGGVAHDFNNLMTVVIGGSEVLLADQTLTPAQREWLEDIRKAGLRGANLTRQLLAFSRKQVRQPRVLDLGSLLAGIASIVQRLVGPDIVLSVAAPADLRAVYADPGQMEQIIMNLAANARDAMNGPGTLAFEVANVDLGEAIAAGTSQIPAGAYVRLRVRDSGAGMNEATRARVFEPFFTTKDVGRNTDLGLSTVYGIVRQSDGFIVVESELGKGTTFDVYFPVHAEKNS
jgi:signal transduction histidine kinase